MLKKEIKEIKEKTDEGNRTQLLHLKKKLAEAYKREELYWSQKVRVKWLQEEDKNTSYFHAMVNGRRKMNRINVLQKRSGEWCENEEETYQEILDYFA